MKVSQLLIALVAMALLAGLWWTMRPAVPSANSAPQMQVFELALGDGKHWVAKRFRVEQGDRVRFEVTSAVDDAMHVHGYEHHLPLPAGAPQTLEFTADRAGQHQLELHGSTLEVGTLEVYPRS
ncbi:hypothetical protein [Abyssibacter sp.]|uniref:hypothetical protein n=1 Tax=Abyssibacter sp. TaxID=2320200 RepID=UPI0025C560CB|nr:hypothetical protein [Abyssibacter sp.]MCK5860761.1 hypothetical protein [Abyssibacter sp.]